MTTALSSRRIAGWALVGGLCLAALVAVFALLTGDFGDTDWRIIASSLAFSLVIAMLLSTALPPILRRLRAPAEAPAGHPAFGSPGRGGPTSTQRLSAELEAIAGRLEELDSSPEVRGEAAKLRRLARERQA